MSNFGGGAFDGGTNISQGGKSGGEASGTVDLHSTSTGALGGGSAIGGSSASAAMGGASGMASGDVSDNTSIGNININS